MTTAKVGGAISATSGGLIATAAGGSGGIAAAVITIIGRPLPTISETTTAFTNVSSANTSPEKLQQHLQQQQLLQQQLMQQSQQQLQQQSQQAALQHHLKQQRDQQQLEQKQRTAASSAAAADAAASSTKTTTIATVAGTAAAIDGNTAAGTVITDDPSTADYMYPTTPAALAKAALAGRKKAHANSADSKRERKAAKTLAIITGAFVCCWLPFFVLAILVPACGDYIEVPDSVQNLFLWLGYFNSTLNPIIYTIFSPEFRNAFTRLLCGRKGAVRRRTGGLRR